MPIQKVDIQEPGAPLVHIDIELSFLSYKIYQEWTGSFLPGTSMDRHGLRIPEHFSKLKYVDV